MRKSIIIGLVAALLLTIFVLKNDTEVPVFLFFGKVDGSLSLILLICIIIGVVLGIIFSVPSISKQSRMIQQKNREIDRLKKILDDNDISYKPEKGKKEKKKEEESKNQQE